MEDGKKFKRVIWGGGLLAIFLAGLSLFYSLYVIEEVIVLPADVYISEEKMGFNLDEDAVHFGIVKKGGSSSERFLEIRNERNYAVEVVVKGKGEIRDWVYSYLRGDEEVGRQKFFLGAGESKEIVVGLVPEKKAEAGKKYSGEIKIVILKDINFYTN